MLKPHRGRRDTQHWCASVDVLPSAQGMRSRDRGVRDCVIAAKPNSELASQTGASSITVLSLTRQCHAAGLIHAVRAAVGERCKLHVLVRPRGGDFLYNPLELKASLSPARKLKSCSSSNLRHKARCLQYRVTLLPEVHSRPSSCACFSLVLLL